MDIVSILFVLLGIILALIIFLIVMYNGLVRSRQKVQNAWSQIDVQLQRRFDLIPNLIETVKGYMKHESELFEKVTALRSSWTNAQTISDKVSIDTELSGVLKTILSVSENYPDLKANTNFIDMQQSLEETEDKISYSRQFYNDAVTMYNTKLEIFPSSIVASMFHFEKENLFKVESDEVRKNVKVDFNNDN